MFLAAVPIWIAFGGNILSRSALAFVERIRIGRHDFVLLDDPGFAFLLAAAFGSEALLRSASFKSMGIPCFLSTSANASSANSWMVAIRSRPSCVSLSKVSSSKAINLRTLVCSWRRLDLFKCRCRKWFRQSAERDRRYSPGCGENQDGWLHPVAEI
jgi:hypothetical protein